MRRRPPRAACLLSPSGCPVVCLCCATSTAEPPVRKKGGGAFVPLPPRTGQGTSRRARATSPSGTASRRAGGRSRRRSSSSCETHSPPLVCGFVFDPFCFGPPLRPSGTWFLTDRPMPNGASCGTSAHWASQPAKQSDAVCLLARALTPLARCRWFDRPWLSGSPWPHRPLHGPPFETRTITNVCGWCLLFRRTLTGAPGTRS